MKDQKEKSICELLGITKGRWRFGEDLESINTDYHEDGKNWNRLNCSSNGFAKCIAKIKNPKWMGKFESKSNASLIAAAPEMLEALIQYYYGRSTELFQMSVEADDHEGVGKKSIQVMEMNIKIKDVIQKATGKTWPEIKGLLNEK